MNDLINQCKMGWMNGLLFDAWSKGRTNERTGEQTNNLIKRTNKLINELINDNERSN